MATFCINLNIHYSATKKIWDRIEKIYSEMPHWKGFVNGCMKMITQQKNHMKNTKIIMKNIRMERNWLETKQFHYDGAKLRMVN